MSGQGKVVCSQSRPGCFSKRSVSQEKLFLQRLTPWITEVSHQVVAQTEMFVEEHYSPRETSV